MTYKKNFLSFVVCTLLLAQPIQSQNQKKRTQPSRWSWEALALTAASIPLALGFLKLINLASNYLSKKDAENQPEPQTIEAFVENLTQEEKKAYKRFNITVIDYLSNKEDWEDIDTTKDARGHDISFLTFLNRNKITKETLNIQPQKIQQLKIDARKNFKEFVQNNPENEKSKEYLAIQNKILSQQENFKYFLQSLQQNAVKNIIIELDKDFKETLQNKYYAILISKPNNIKQNETKTLWVKEYKNITLPLYARLFNQTKNTIYEEFTQYAPTLGTTDQNKEKSIISLIDFTYDQDQKKFNRETKEIYLNQISKYFIDAYLKYWEPTKTLKRINDNTTILDQAMKKALLKEAKPTENKQPPTPQQRVKIYEEQKPHESFDNSTSLRVLNPNLQQQSNPVMTQETLSPLNPNESAEDFQHLNPEKPPQYSIKRLPDYN